MMKRSAILINATRGEAVHQEDLYTALRDRVIAGAGYIHIYIYIQREREREGDYIYI